MPGNFREIEILDVLAINVNLETVRQPRNPLDDTAFGSVAFVKKGRYDCQSRPSRTRGHRYTLACIISHQRASTKIVDGPQSVIERLDHSWCGQSNRKARNSQQVCALASVMRLVNESSSDPIVRAGQ